MLQHAHSLQLQVKALVPVLAQDSTTSGANVKKLEAESSATVKSIEKSIASKKKEARYAAPCSANHAHSDVHLLPGASWLSAACSLAPCPRV